VTRAADLDFTVFGDLVRGSTRPMSNLVALGRQLVDTGDNDLAIGAVRIHRRNAAGVQLENEQTTERGFRSDLGFEF
jgi:hypothetical protein